MKKIWQGLGKAWNYFDGKKTYIGGIVYLLAKGGQAFAPTLLPPQQYEFIQIVGESLLGVGLGHKLVKSDTVNNAIKKAQNSMQKGKPNNQ